MHNEFNKLTPVLVPKTDPTEASLVELSALLTKPHHSLVEFLSAIAFDGGVHLLSNDVKALPVFRTHMTSGFNYALETKMLAYVRLGFTTSGYTVIQSLLMDGVSAWVSHYYSAEGKYAFSEGPISHTFVGQTEVLFEAACPILNHLYNALSQEYVRVSEGRANTRLAHTMERVFRLIQKTNPKKLSISKGIHDPALLALNDRLMAVELDPVYSWKERKALITSIKEERKSLISTKKRAHQKSFLHYTLPLFIFDTKAAFERFQKRPLNNSLGFLEFFLLDPIRWFFGQVRGNLGFSVAMAIYSPFTYFFITQPMNPHAMSVVGVVRSAYIETVDHVNNFVHPGATTAAAVKAVTTDSSDPKKNYSELKPSFGNLLVSSDAPDVASQTWEDRMSNFKAMEISYEENMEVAPRLGRLEQMETQLNWPMIVEGAWLESERYMEELNFFEANAKNYKPEFSKFVHSEKERLDRVQLYLWDRNVRFILDHPFTMMDQSAEQTQMDYYVGRSFVLLRDMTNSLALSHKGLAMPAGYVSINQLAQKFETDYRDAGGSVLDRLKANSKVFAQQDKASTDELRRYMKREWEVLYLLQNHAQEASNFGLQVYIWSVRNTVYTLQSMISTKRDELSVIGFNMLANANNGTAVNKLTGNPTFRRSDSQYEALYHMMVLEYASIRKEIGEALKKDIESVQRKQILGDVESFLKERDALLRGAKLI